MNVDSSIEIDRPAAHVWDVFTDVERWPDWTASVTSLVALDGPGLAIGKRFEIQQPRMPKLVWVVSQLSPGTSWSWEQRAPGGLTIATHELEVLTPERTLVRQRIDARGPVGATVGFLMLRMTRRYLDLEAQGLKAQSEARSRHDAPSA